jgi:3-methyladenine DNA glycosylase AlkD
MNAMDRHSPKPYRRVATGQMNLRRRVSELRKLANSDDWWDREIAGFALRDLVEDHFVEGMKLTSRWPHDRSARIRRAACQSLMQRRAKTTDERLQPILQRVEVLMKDDDIYVRKCCGPYVVAYLALRLANHWELGARKMA